MKITKKELELISAYLDRELSESEIHEIEQRMEASGEFKAEVDSLRKIKDLSSSAYEKLPESEYFASRVMSKINSGHSRNLKVRKWMPVMGITALTLILMLVLKLNPGILDKLVEKQKTTLAGFYKQNLQPLLFAANLTNEDIFNFAFNKQLPLDKSRNQYISLGTDSTGREYFEIKKVPESKPENNLGKFVSALNLDERQKDQVDSIISSYAGELESQILVNENNTVAINPNLWNYNKALVADLLAFAEKSNKKQYVKLVPLDYRDINQLKVVHAVNEVKKAKNDDYIFLTPDTVFSDKYYFNKQQFKKEMEDMKKDLAMTSKDLKKMQFNFDFSSDSIKYKYQKKFDTTWVKNFQIMIDSNICRVKIPRVVLPPEMPHFDSIFSNMHLEKLSEKLKNLTIEIPRGFPGKGGEFKFNYGKGDSASSFKFNIPPVNVDSIVRESMKVLDSLNIKMPKEFYFGPDSARQEKYYNMFLHPDSLTKIKNGDFRKNMEKMRKELKKEMEDLRIKMKQKKYPSLDERIDTVRG